MKNISDLKRRLEIIYAKKHCDINNISNCKKEHCTCSVAAEIKAHIDSIIPYPYNNYSIHNFNGKFSNSKNKLPDYIYKDAKKKLIEYCWENITFENIEKMSLESINANSIIQKRYKQGKNVVIFSDDVQTNMMQSGKTFIASLILKEAIKSRINPNFSFQTYDWINYSSLKEKLASNSDSVLNTKSSNWLVIDDITDDTLASSGQKAYISSKIDAFLSERLEMNLPTIFVFRFDVMTYSTRMEEVLGVSIIKTINSDFTHKISLVR